MRRLLLALLLLLPISAAAQVPAQPASTSKSLTSTTCPGTGCVQLNVSGYASAAIQITGTFTATVTFEVSVDGTTYQAVNATPTNSTSAATTATSTGNWSASVAGQKYLRARVSAYTSGTAVVSLQSALAGGGSGGGGGGGSAPSGTIGAAVPSTASPIAVKDGSGNLQYPLVDVSGNLLVAVTGAGSGGTSSVDGAAYTAGTTAGTPAMGVRDDTGTTACAEDKACIARLTSARALMVDGSATTQPVSGTVTANAGTGNFTVAQGTAANLNATIVGTGTFAVQAAQSGTWNITNVSGTVSLPTGAATAAKQPALGTAGTASADVITVQGRSGMTALLVDGSAVTQPVSGSLTVTQGTGTNLHIVCDSGCSSSAGFADNAAFTFGTTAVNPMAGVLDDVGTNAATENSAAVARITAQKALHVNFRNNAGTEIGTSSNPIQVTLANTGANATAVKTDGSAVTQPVSIAATVTVAGAKTNNNAAPGATNVGALGNLANAATPSWTEGNLVAGSVDLHGSTRVLQMDASGNAITVPAANPCASTTPTHAVFSINTATTTQLIAASASNKNYICSLNLVVAGADNVALIEDDTAACASPTAGMAGGTTAATGWNFAANGGMTFGNGAAAVFITAATNRYTCFITSAAVQLSGSLTYVQAP